MVNKEFYVKEKTPQGRLKSLFIVMIALTFFMGMILGHSFNLPRDMFLRSLWALMGFSTFGIWVYVMSSFEKRLKKLIKRY